MINLIPTPEQFVCSFGEPAPGVLLGLDPGSNTIGVASSDLRQRIASPFGVISRTKFTRDLAALLDICDRQRAVGFVIGMPVLLSGQRGPRADSVVSFAHNLAKATDLPIMFWDERYSTIAAERVMLETGLSRKKRAANIDAAAAGYILQGVLDRLTIIREQEFARKT